MRKKILNLFRGWIGEKKTTFYLWLSLRKKSYRKFHNIILPSKNGTTQVDHIIISVYGLFIIETKNLKGWIFGSKKQSKWTQSIYGNNYSFQNPLRQTFRQKSILSEFLDVNKSDIHTVIYFTGGCKFKTTLPDNVIKSGLGRYIKHFRDQILSTDEVNQLVKFMEVYLSNSSLTKSDHLKSLRKRRSLNTICPRCGSNLVKRTAKKGPNAGKQFLGCENYPTCRFTKDL